MQDNGERPGQTGGVSNRAMDVLVAAILMAVGAVVMLESYQIGAGWSATGPETGYFPFYVGLLILVSSAATLGISLLGRSSDRASFVDSKRFGRVLQVLVPSTVFVLVIDYVGMYVAGTLLIAFFMWWLGKYPVHKVAVVSVLVPLVFFLMFEIWFLVPLPKGPVEAFFGY